MGATTMETAFYVLNLTDPEKTITAKFAGVEKRHQIRKLSDIPDAATSRQMVLYVIGHAIPNGLIGPDNAILPEAEIATAIQRRRGYAPTLIVWDVCFAKSLLDISGAPAWTSNFVHVFSCQPYERTWHLGPPSTTDDGSRPPSGERPTGFSIELASALGALEPGASWETLESALRERLFPVQRPEITPKSSMRLPADFDLKHLIGGGASSASASADGARVSGAPLTAAVGRGRRSQRNASAVGAGGSRRSA
jgi:hypothetical protein